MTLPRFMSSYVDAHVAYAESGLEITGQWRTADGSVGTVTGTKALAGLALGGLWHLGRDRCVSVGDHGG